MPTVIQTVSSGLLGGVANKTVTLTATQPGNALIVSMAIEGGATAYTGFTIADNAGGGSNTYSQAGITTASALFRSCCVKYCLAPTSGVTSVTVTGTGGSGGMYGVFSVQEVSGISALDRYTAGATGASSPYTMTASAVDTAATDFVVSCISVGNGSATVGISNPPTGYTTAAISQNDSTDAGGAIAYRINTTAVTDTCQWAATSWVATAPVNIVSFVGSGGVTDTTITPSAGTAALAGVTPTVTRSGTGGSTITPNTGALSAAGQAPIRSVGVSIAPAVAALALAGIVSVQTLTVVPPVTGALTLAGQAPTVSVAAGVVRTPSVGSIGLTATAPIIIRSQAIAPAVGVISAGGQAPSLLLASICIPNSGALSLTGSTPVSPGTIVPTATSMTLTGNAPVLLRAFTVAPNAAALGFVGFAPQSGNAVSISPTAGSLSLNGVAAVLTRAGSIIPNSAALGITGAAPQIGGQIVITPAVGSTTIAGSAPTIVRATLLSPATGLLSLAGNFPVIGGQFVLSPGTGSLTLNGQSPALGGSFTVIPPTGALFLTGQQAVAFLPGTLKPNTVSMSFSGLAPGVFTGAPILVGNPYYSVQRPRKREFTVSACTFLDFPTKDSAESVELTFDFTVELPTGIKLTGLPTISVTVAAGSDLSPGSIFNGPAGFDSGLTQVIVPVKGGIANCDYDIKVVVPTTDSLTILALSGILPVRA